MNRIAVFARKCRRYGRRALTEYRGLNYCVTLNFMIQVERMSVFYALVYTGFVRVYINSSISNNTSLFGSLNLLPRFIWLVDELFHCKVDISSK